MQKGDRFIYYGKSNTFIGRVDRVIEKSAYDLDNGVKIIKEYVVSEEGERFERQDCRKIVDSISFNFIKRIKKMLK